MINTAEESCLSMYSVNNHTKYESQEKNFGSGQFIFENWSCGPVDFFEAQPKFFKSNKCQHADMVCRCRGGNLEVSGAGCQVLGRLAAFQAWRKSGVLEGGGAT